MITIEALDHNTRIDAATTGAVHDNLAQPIETTATYLATTHYINYIADHPNIEALQVIDPEVTVGHIYYHPTDLQGMNHVDQVHNPARKKENYMPRRT